MKPASKPTPKTTPKEKPWFFQLTFSKKDERSGWCHDKKFYGGYESKAVANTAAKNRLKGIVTGSDRRYSIPTGYNLFKLDETVKVKVVLDLK